MLSTSQDELSREMLIVIKISIIYIYIYMLYVLCKARVHCKN